MSIHPNGLGGWTTSSQGHALEIPRLKDGISAPWRSEFSVLSFESDEFPRLLKARSLLRIHLNSASLKHSDIVVLYTPLEAFGTIGAFYFEFTQLSDAEVVDLMKNFVPKAA